MHVEFRQNLDQTSVYHHEAGSSSTASLSFVAHTIRLTAEGGADGLQF